MSLATRIAQEFNNVRSHISGITAYHLLQGNLSVSNEVITNGFSTTLYTGNGGAQAINTGVDMATQHGDDVSEMCGGLSWIKCKSAATNHYFVDTVRGATKDIYSNATTAETTEATGLTSFNSTGFSLGTLAGMNTNLATYASWNFQTTHRRTGVTNHGKAYTEHYNPFTGFTIIKYEGSGIAGHEIPHSLGRKLGFRTVKNLSAVYDWVAEYDDNGYLNLNSTNAYNTTYKTTSSDTAYIINSAVANWNQATNQYIMYNWANSYLDETNKLIGNYEVGVYQGTGVAGNKVITRGKPAWIMIKRLDSAADWVIWDNQRATKYLLANSVQAEVDDANDVVFNINDFILYTAGGTFNASGGQYLYMVVYDNDSGSGKSKYPKATDTSNVQINNALIPLAHGVDSNGSKNSIVVANETITGLTYTQGKNYLYRTDTGYGVKPYEPRYLSSELVRSFAGESPDYYDVESNKWFNTDAGSAIYSNSGNNITGWYKNSGNGTTLTTDGFVLSTSNDATGSLYVNYLLTGLSVGKKYTVSVNVTSISGNSLIFIGNSNLYGTTAPDTSGYASSNTILSGTNGIATLSFIANETSATLGLRNTSASSSNKWDNVFVFPVDITPTTEITESRNYLNAIVHADQNGQVTYVEELPKIEYKDIIKANKYQGKNACTAYAKYDTTTTPPTFKEGFNAGALIRTATGEYDFYTETPCDTLNACPIVGFKRSVSSVANSNYIFQTSLNKFHATHLENGVVQNGEEITIHIFGGKN